jgi:prepilin-type N-terminal cleavage/methylation domain-containing protein
VPERSGMTAQTSKWNNQRGFSLIEVMSAAMVLSIFITAIGAVWITADRRVNELVTRQKAIFVANMEMERITTLYDTTAFGGTGPVNTTGYTETPAFPSTRLIYPTPLSPIFIPAGQDYTTASTSTFTSGDPFEVLVNTNLLSSLNRSYVWIDKAQGVMGRISWTTSGINASPCVGLDGCACLDSAGLLSAQCQKLVLYLEYPYRLVSSNPVPGSNLRTLTLATIVGRHT